MCTAKQIYPRCRQHTRRSGYGIADPHRTEIQLECAVCANGRCCNALQQQTPWRKTMSWGFVDGLSHPPPWLGSQDSTAWQRSAQPGQDFKIRHSDTSHVLRHSHSWYWPCWRIAIALHSSGHSLFQQRPTIRLLRPAWTSCEAQQSP